MIRALTTADTAETLALLRARPLHNVFLEYVVSIGGLGWVRGMVGYAAHGRLEGILMVGPLGGTVLEVRGADAYAPLAESASQQPVRPRHLIGSEDVTEPFWRKYSEYAAPTIWMRREPVYLLDAEALQRSGMGVDCVRIERARERDADAIVTHSALQHREDLKEDRYALDPEGFVQRHEKDIRDGRWWVTRENGRIVFQVHVGARSPYVVQIGGVFTPPDLRNAGHAKRGMAAIAERLLSERPRVSLFCAEDNQPARSVYEHVGFRVAHQNRSWLLDEASVPENRGQYA